MEIADFDRLVLVRHLWRRMAKFEHPNRHDIISDWCGPWIWLPFSRSDCYG